jgi:plastocyanin
MIQKDHITSAPGKWIRVDFPSGDLFSMISKSLPFESQGGCGLDSVLKLGGTHPRCCRGCVMRIVTELLSSSYGREEQFEYNTICIINITYIDKGDKMNIKLTGAFFVIAIVLAGCAPQAAAPVASIPATSLPVVSGSEAKINISGFAFDPVTITIKVGETVTWTNQDNVVHTVAADDNSWTSDNLGKGASFSHTFNTAGTFTYHCGVHPNMKGTVIVQP